MEARKIIITKMTEGGPLVTPCNLRVTLGPMSYVVYDKTLKKSFICTIDEQNKGDFNVLLLDKYDRETNSFENVTVTFEEPKK